MLREAGWELRRVEDETVVMVYIDERAIAEIVARQELANRAMRQ